MHPVEDSLHVARDVADAVEFLARNSRLAIEQGTHRIARLILLDLEVSNSRANEIAEFIKRAL